MSLYSGWIANVVLVYSRLERTVGTRVTKGKPTSAVFISALLIQSNRDAEAKRESDRSETELVFSGRGAVSNWCDWRGWCNCAKSHLRRPDSLKNLPRFFIKIPKDFTLILFFLDDLGSFRALLLSDLAFCEVISDYPALLGTSLEFSGNRYDSSEICS